MDVFNRGEVSMSKGTMGALYALCAASVCALSAPALAQDDAAQETGAVAVSADTDGVGSSSVGSSSGRGAVGPLRINVGLHLGLGGDLKLEADEGGGESEDDLLVTPGLQAGADYVVMDYFSIGGELRLSWFNTDGGDDADIGRSMFFDLDVKPKGRYAFSKIPLEVYGTLPLGLSVAAMNDDTGLDGGAGFNLGFGPGATYFFTDRIGINTEMLGVFHWWGVEAENGLGEASARTGQFYWFFNGVFAI
jgi:hypothetical protein